MCGVIAFVADRPAAWRWRGQQGHRALCRRHVRRSKGAHAACLLRRRAHGFLSSVRRASGQWPGSSPLLRQQLSMGLDGGAVDHHERRSSHSTRAAKIFCHTPRLLPRLKRLNTVYGPYSPEARASGSSRKRSRMPLITRRSSLRSGPVWTFGRCASISAHCASFSVHRSARNCRP